MITHGSLDVSSASSPAEIRTSVMSGLSCLVVAVRVDPKSFQNSRIRQHFAKLFGCRGYDCDEVGLAEPALDAMALEVTARAAMKHRRMSGRDACLADVQAKRQHTPPIAVVGVVGITRQFHGFQFKIRKQIPEVSRLLLQVAIDVAKRLDDLVQDRDPVPDQAERH